MPLCTYAQWPPYHDEFRENFTNNRSAFDALEKKIVGTEYFRVSVTGIFGIPRFDDSTGVVGEMEGDEYPESVVIKDDPEWDELLGQANIFAVNNRNNVVSFSLISAIEQGGRKTYVDYVHSVETRDTRRPCLPEYRTLDCGRCVVELVEDRYIEYSWSPVELVPGERNSVLDDDASANEYWDNFDRNLKQCIDNGYKAIGYKLNAWQE